MDMKALAEAAYMFSTAAYETTYGNWVFDPDEYDTTVDPYELEKALRYVGGDYLLEVDRYDGRFDLTLSTYYMKDGDPDKEYDNPYSDDTGCEWADAWETAAACKLFAYVFEFGGGWMKQEYLIADTVLGEYVPCNEAVLDKCKAIFGLRVADLEHINWKLHITVRKKAEPTIEGVLREFSWELAPEMTTISDSDYEEIICEYAKRLRALTERRES